MDATVYDDQIALETFTEATSKSLADAYNAKAGGAILPAILAILGPLLMQVITGLLARCPNPTPAKVHQQVGNPSLIYRMMLNASIRRTKDANPDVEIDHDIAKATILEHSAAATQEDCKKVIAVTKLVN